MKNALRILLVGAVAAGAACGHAETAKNTGIDWMLQTNRMQRTQTKAARPNVLVLGDNQPDKAHYNEKGNDALAARGPGLAERIAAKYTVKSTDAWQGGRRIVFDFQGHDAWVVEPPAGVAPAKGRPWTWTMQWRTAYVPRTGVPKLLARGFHHAAIDTYDHRMDEKGLAVSKAFQDFLVKDLGLAPKARLIGMSWGGFFSIRYAARFPEGIDRIYLDAPLITFWDVPPGQKQKFDVAGWEALAPADGKWTADPRMPLNLAGQIVKSGVPVFIVYGGQDSLTPEAVHAIPFIERFRKAGGGDRLKVLRRDLYGHHPHGFGLDDDTLVEFLAGGAELHRVHAANL